MLHLLTLLAAAAVPSSGVSPAHEPGQLSALLDARDYLGLKAVLGAPASAADVRSDLDWEKAEMLAGASSLVAF